MIEYLIKENPDDRVIQRAVELLKSGELVAIHLDVGWFVVGDYLNKNAFKSLISFPRSEENEDAKELFFICVGPNQAGQLVEITNSHFKLFKKNSGTPLCYRFQPTVRPARLLKGTGLSNKYIRIYFSDSELIERLVQQVERPVAAIRIDESLFDTREVGEEIEIYSYLIEEKFGHRMSLILDPGPEVPPVPIVVMDLTEDRI